MVKGISKRVVIIKGKESESFEEAIFIVKDQNVTRDDVLKEACRLISAQNPRTKRSRRRLFLLCSALLGAGVMGAVWLACTLIL
jgi:hypothetical protein